MTRPCFKLSIDLQIGSTFSFVNVNGVSQRLGTLNLTRESLEHLIDLIGRGEEDAKAEFEIENIQEIFYADQEKRGGVGGVEDLTYTGGGEATP